MNYPTAVQESAQKAREMMQQQGAAKTDQGQHETLAPPENSTAQAPGRDGNTGQEGTPAGEQNPSQQAQQAPAPAGEEEEGEKDWKTEYERLNEAHEQLKHKYSVLQGKYNAEVPRLSEENRQLKEQLQNAPSSADGSQAPVDISQIDPEQYREYGDEFVGMAQTLQQIAKEVGGVKDTVMQGQQQAEQSAVEQYWTQVYRDVPQFDDINNSPEFLEWLNGYMDTPQGKRIRNSVLQEAHAAGDATSVVRVFQDFVNESKNNSAAQNRQENSPSQGQPNISPPAGASSPPPASPNEAPTYTRAQVEEFFQNLSHGRFRGQEEWARAEKERILQAGRDGRIR